MITEIQNDFYRLTLRLPYRLRHVNAYLVAHEQDLALFDTGLAVPGAFKMLEEDLKSIGFDATRIRQIYLTHIHSDHCGLAGVLQKHSGAQIHLSPAAFEEYQHHRKTDPAVRQLRKFYTRHGMPAHHIQQVIDEFESIRSLISEMHNPVLLRNGETKSFGNRTFQVIFTPGHCFGHVCFFFPNEGYLLAGDHILPYIAPILSPNIFDEDFRPLKAYFDSFDLLAALPVSTVLPGHGTYFTDLKERLADIRAHHEKRMVSVREHISDNPTNANDIANRITPSAVSDFDKFLTLNEVIIYLQELAAAGGIKEESQDPIITYRKG